ncbi:MAG: phage scaffolding protein [Candidatus Fimenecus sp.]|nr:phage scaffolding protein [Candidatus Fimenecus sp.]
MNLIEILKANGIEDDVITKITGDMKTNKVFTAGEDNLDIRYGKLKTEHAQAQQSISDLQAQISQFEQLKSQNATLIDEANKKLADLQAENDRIKLDNALERALIEAKVQDVDYMKFKLKEKHPDGFKLDENGKIESINTVLDDLKVQFPNQFAKTEKKIEEKKLEKSDDNNGGISSEQFSKMDYHERAKLFKENPEQYAELNKN